MKALGILAAAALLVLGAPPVAAVDWTTLPIEELRHRANANEVAAMEEIGRRLIQGITAPKDPGAGAGWLRRAAEMGSASSAYSVAVMYERGLIFERDSGRAVEWYRKAADGNVALAKHNLALMLRDGRGTPRDDREAVDLLRSAAHQGTLVSMVMLADMHERGDGVPLNRATALAWFAIAAEYDRQVNRGTPSALARTAAERAAALRETLSRAELLEAQDLAQAEYKRLRDTVLPPKPFPPPPTAAEDPPIVLPKPVDDEAIGWPKEAAEQVRAVQQALFDLKLLRDKPDGVLGPLTRTAIRDAQRTAGLAETGEPSRELLLALKATRRDVVDSSPLPTPAKVEASAEPAPAGADGWPADRTEQLKAIQIRLRELGLYAGGPTGQLGPLTQAGIREFQRSNGLPQTGEPSRELYLALKAPPAPSKPEAAAPPTSAPPAPADPAPAVADGWPADRTEQLKAIQILLRDLKYYNGGPTGQLGPLTQAGIRDFQRAAGRPQTGEPSRELYLALKTAPPATAPVDAARPLDTVRTIQSALRDLGFYTDAVDGMVGERTRAAISDFQRSMGLEETGEPSESLLQNLKSLGRTTAEKEN